MTRIVDVEALTEEEFGSLICYPRRDPKEFRRRLHELTKLGIRRIKLGGPSRVFDYEVLGKGFVSIVVTAELDDGRECALKIRRIDADRKNTSHEVQMLRKANKLGIGPKLFKHSPNFVAMELIQGEFINEWIKKLKGRGTKATVRKIVATILNQCFTLDSGGLDHGELSRATRHFIISNSDRVQIIDFETASDKRRASNVTAAGQYLLIGSAVARRIRRILGITSTEHVIDALRGYKKEPTKDNLRKILCAANIVEGELA